MLHLLRTNSDHPDFHLLIRELDQDLWRRYEEGQADYAPHNIIQNNKHVLLAYWNQTPVGCGCFKHFDEDSVEMKRMYVQPDHRGKGIAATILQGLEEWAQEEGYIKAVLEMGNKQPEAAKLYHKLTYTPIPLFGPYIHLDNSICLGKELTAPV